MSARSGVGRWHAYMAGGKQSGDLRAMLAADAVFHSPVVHTPQQGADKVFAYLDAASRVLGSAPDFAYVRTLIDEPHALMEFQATIGGISINGIDLVTFNSDGKITDFKVMVRPLKAVNKLWEMMGAELARAG